MFASNDQVLLPQVRQLEAAAFRAWPAFSTVYDGAWLTRLSPFLPAKRLNSINFLDPQDHQNIEQRINQAKLLFDKENRPLVVRVSPLAPPQVIQYFEKKNWIKFDLSYVMTCDLRRLDLEKIVDQIPMRDSARFAQAFATIHGQSDDEACAIASQIDTIEPAKGLFLGESNGEPISTAICVYEGMMAGLFEVATRSDMRGQGFGKGIILGALKWARLNRARTAWLQVEKSNSGAIGLYESLGFTRAYEYHYYRPSKSI